MPTYKKKRILIRVGIFIVLSIVAFNVFFNFQKKQKTSQIQPENTRFFKIQSIDTMKYSRDVAREKLNDSSYDQVIDTQVKQIAATGATHVAIATPYDDEFLPFLKRWVFAARKYKLNVWFRGNFSGWEGWFDYPTIDRIEHAKKTKEFILNNADLFQDGDIFVSCPECENGGPGDPRQTRDITGHRDFLIGEYELAKQAFQEIHKKVAANYYSMNGDVARIVMDKQTTKALDGIVTIDHYVQTPDQLIEDINDYAKNSGGNVVLGEWGVPIPDINGTMSQAEQSAWIDRFLTELIQNPNIVGLNYWTSVGGSTSLWNESMESREAVSVLTKFYRPSFVTGNVVSNRNRLIPGAIIQTKYQQTVSDANGTYAIPILDDEEIQVSMSGYIGRTLSASRDAKKNKMTVKLQPEKITFIDRFYNLFGGR